VDALSVLSSRVTVCQGYSNLYAALMRAAGIRAKIVSGRLYNKGVPSDQSPEQICNAPYDPETNHAWNEVYVDNRWMTVDVTSDAGYSLDNTTAGFQHTPYNHRAFDPSTQYYQRKYVKCSDDTQ
jgi:transglutaminase-like putative cysteine protease